MVPPPSDAMIGECVSLLCMCGVSAFYLSVCANACVLGVDTCECACKVGKDCGSEKR